MQQEKFQISEGESSVVQMEEQETGARSGCRISVLGGGQSLIRQGPEQPEGTFESGLVLNGRLGYVLQRSLQA